MRRPVRDFAGHSERRAGPAGRIGAAVLAGGGLGALLLVVAELTPLFEIHTAASAAAVSSVTTGSHNAYALVPVALLAGALAFGFWQSGSRPALLAIGVLGVISLLIALLGDLPDAHASGLIGTASSHYAVATARPSAGFYLETLGAVVLLITCVSGFILLGPPARPPRSEHPAPGRPRPSDA